MEGSQQTNMYIKVGGDLFFRRRHTATIAFVTGVILYFYCPLWKYDVMRWLLPAIRAWVLLPGHRGSFRLSTAKFPEYRDVCKYGYREKGQEATTQYFCIYCFSRWYSRMGILPFSIKSKEPGLPVCRVAGHANALSGNDTNESADEFANEGQWKNQKYSP